MSFKPRYLLLAIILIVCGYVAAPALSSKPYLPEAVDFQQRLPTIDPAAAGTAAKRVRPLARAGRGPVSFRSGVITAPERFDLVGLAGELRPLEIRARDTDGEWSRWIESAAGDPVYFGGADQLELRTRGWRPRGTLHYVNVSGTTSTLGGLLSGARRAINSAFISASALVEPEAEATPTRPRMISRAAWGANRVDGGCRPRAAPVYGTVKAAVVHHTVTANDYSESEAPAIVLGICRYHRNANGWNDIGYNALVDRFGNVYQGRAGGIKRAVVGAHAQGFNSITTGVAVIGTQTTTPITPATKTSLVGYLAWRLTAAGLTARGKTTLTSAGGELSRYPAGRRVRLNKIFGHGTVGLTECPGRALETRMAKIRRLVQARIAGSGPAPPPPQPPPTDGGGVNPK